MTISAGPFRRRPRKLRQCCAALTGDPRLAPFPLLLPSRVERGIRDWGSEVSAMASHRAKFPSSSCRSRHFVCREGRADFGGSGRLTPRFLYRVDCGFH